MKPRTAEMEKATYSLCEAVVDITHNFARQQNLPNDSREFARLCIEWAELFESRNVGREWNGEYIEEIDAFFTQQYEAWLVDPATSTRPNHNF